MKYHKKVIIINNKIEVTELLNNYNLKKKKIHETKIS